MTATDLERLVIQLELLRSIRSVGASRAQAEACRFVHSFRLRAAETCKFVPSFGLHETFATRHIAPRSSLWLSDGSVLL
jgi:hypothetical protein